MGALLQLPLAEVEASRRQGQVAGGWLTPDCVFQKIEAQVTKLLMTQPGKLCITSTTLFFGQKEGQPKYKGKKIDKDMNIGRHDSLGRRLWRLTTIMLRFVYSVSRIPT